MFLYSDVITGDEMFSDAFPIKTVEDIVYEVDCQLIEVKPGVDVDIGAHPRGEEEEEQLNDGTQQVNNVVHSFRLQSTSFDKKSFLAYLKGYMEAVKNHLSKTNPDRVQVFEEGASNYAKRIIANFGIFEFYTGESVNPGGMVALLSYRNDGITPFLTFWKDGLTEENL